ncbi:hypothetical protein LR48_Vigan07g246700 [Vigna angularis]|uniref:Uncharacterized protein n=2 Tax=Phaseolus angularis TaxID=3914 RepID=A0A0L9V146_PHAAN|nr:uncharacterized protein HKW66_Vig0224570 [Vigna angularis]KOM48763.1 hypothetical protein LR48_Vigan07g246700 [Vigna angularis]
MSTKASSCADAEGHVSANQNFGQHRQQQLGKQVRRRLTNRPYQERLMNMAEARKEITTALKYHRATTKLTTEHQRQLQHHHQQHQSLFFQLPFYSRFSPDGRFKARRRPMMYPPISNKISQYLNDFSFSLSFPPLPSLPLHSPPLHLPLPPPSSPIQNFYPHTLTSPFSPPPLKPEPPNFTLPSQTLGFNLNLHSFNSSEPTLLLNNNTFDPPFYLENNTLDPTLFLDNNTSNTSFLLDNNNTLDPTLLFDNNILDDTHVLNNNILDGTPVLNNNILDGTPVFNYNNNLEPIPLSSNNVSSLCSYSTPTLTSPPFLTQQDVPLIGISQSQGEMVSTTMNIIESSTTNQASGSMHIAMDEEGMKEIRALGQQHQMEWDDTTSMITSARWYDYLQQMENNATAVNNGDDTCHGIFDDQLEFPI